MAGIVFLKCKDLAKCRKFYTERVGMRIWLEQPDISILRHGNMLIGFHETGSADTGCLLTFFYETREAVDAIYRDLGAPGPVPRVNEKYRIYHFFSKDPEGRDMEFQAFLHPVTVP